MPAIVNISPRILPRATTNANSGSIIEAADMLLADRRAKEEAAARKAELEANRDLERELVGMRGDVESGHIEQRGGVERELIGVRGDVEGGLIDRRGDIESGHIDQRGAIEGGHIEQRGGVERQNMGHARELTAGDREFDQDLRTRQLELDELRVRTGANNDTARMLHEFDNPRTTGSQFPLAGLATSLAGQGFIDAGEGEFDRGRIQELIAISRGEAGGPAGNVAGPGGAPVRSRPLQAAGEAAGAVQRVPPAVRSDVPSGRDTVAQFDPAGGFDLTGKEAEELRGLPLESHVELLRMLPEERDRLEYLQMLPEDVAAEVMRVLRGGR